MKVSKPLAAAYDTEGPQGSFVHIAQVVIPMTIEQRDVLRFLAANQGASMSGYVRWLLRKAAEEYDNEEAGR